ncbi:outer membrane beta-barrel protein [Fulvivirgaceae bacterium BMA12]|uniref:Outer membrane beta-barrel protein n=1 Tax=Agaribacillus aureus TaxID=3051825 RepID=A0ABT8L0W1_9BACT|nr:outer membrane beta-barrel protein [Fulvivirgaceae bacterium BMA12]
MDHKDFDDRIREKFAELNPKFSPDSWDDMADILRYSAPQPWYQRWQKAFWTGGLLFFSLLNFYLLWQIRSEKNGLHDLKHQPQSMVQVVDTIRVFDTLFITKNVARTAPTQTAGQAISSQSLSNTWWPAKSGKGVPNYLNLSASLHNNAFPQSSWKSFLSPVQYPASGDPALVKSEDIATIESEIVDPEKWLEDYRQRVTIKGVKRGKKTPHRKYLSNPFEARLGVTAGLLVPDPDIGERYISEKFGLQGEFSLKRNLRFLTGIHLNRFNYKLDEVDDNNFNAEDLARYPGYAELGRIPDEIIIDNEIIQVPIHLRVYKDLNYSWSVFMSGGPTIDFLLNQSFNYKYIEIDNDQLVETNEVRQEKDLRIYLGNFTGSVGIEHKFGRKLAGQMSVDYQYGLGKLGVERRSVNALSLNLGAFYKLR